MNAKPPVFATLGCRLNAYETEAMREMADAAGLQGAVIVNTSRGEVIDENALTRMLRAGTTRARSRAPRRAQRPLPALSM